MGNLVELWYCIHCSYVGYEYVKNDKAHELCPKCSWVVYSDSEVKKDLGSNCYPKLKEKYERIHKLK